MKITFTAKEKEHIEYLVAHGMSYDVAIAEVLANREPYEN